MQAWILPALLLVFGYGLFIGLASGQEPLKPVDPGKAKPGKRQSQPAPERPREPLESKPIADLEVIRLKFADATEIAQLLKIALGFKTADGEETGALQFPIAVDDRTNSLVVGARTEGEVARVHAIVAKLDVAPESKEADPKNLSVIPLGSIQPDRSLEDALKLVLVGKHPLANFTIDRQRRALIIWADDNTKRTATELLARLEQTGRNEQKLNATAAELRIRVIWLVSIPAQQGGPPLPEDLKEIAPGLAKLGLEHPRLAAQIVISAMPGTEFQAKGVARLDSPCQFSVSGRVLSGTEPPKLNIDLRANRPRASAPQELCTLRTEISAPLGHLVVLGMTPTDETTSAFVVQVLGK
jgi:hypothetical protein